MEEIEEKGPAQRSVKSVLLTNIIIIILCFAMLVTSTFSWFTDSVSNGMNRIVSGTLNVEAEYYDGHEWKSLENASTLFQTADWEPGAVDVVYLRILNAGSLALKYKVSVQTLRENPGTNQEGKDFYVSQFLRFAVVEERNGELKPFATRDEALAAATAVETKTLNSEVLTINDISEDIVLQPDTYSYIALVVTMPSDTGNEANYATGKDQPKVTLGIEILATQAESEADSFGTNYDAQAEYPTPTIKPTEAP